VDGRQPSERSGVFFADGTAKASAAGTAQAAVSAMRDVAVCPGLAVPVEVRTLELPERLSPRGAPVVRLTCTRACLYLITLERADGKPVLARRGTHSGAATPVAVRLPKAPLPAGAYRFTVRTIGQLNPGPVRTVSGGPLSVG
jgi:hypothetical protein